MRHPAATPLPAPDPATRRPVVRTRPYGSIIARLFDPTVTGPAERNLYRWLYRQFRRIEHASPFSARAQIVSASLRVDSVRSNDFDLITGPSVEVW